MEEIISRKCCGVEKKKLKFVQEIKVLDENSLKSLSYCFFLGFFFFFFFIHKNLIISFIYTHLLAYVAVANVSLLQCFLSLKKGYFSTKHYTTLKFQQWFLDYNMPSFMLSHIIY